MSIRFAQDFKTGSVHATTTILRLQPILYRPMATKPSIIPLEVLRNVAMDMSREMSRDKLLKLWGTPFTEYR